ncbi:MAG TPA: PAS domain S-box protein, partial [Opitutus sp.]|nr:PAS domain S-box protein [Opitutus sp.]
ERMLGYTSTELVGRAKPDMFHVLSELKGRGAELSERIGREVAPGFEAVVAMARGGEVDEREWTYVRKDGKRLPVLLTTTALRDREGEVTGFLCIAQDLTERKRAEAALLASEQRLRQVLAHADCLVWEAGVRMTASDWNWRYTVYPSGLYRRLFGEGDTQQNAGLWYRFEIPEREELNRRSREALEQGRSGYVQEFRVPHNGGITWMRESVAIREVEPGYFWLVGVAIDVTKQKDAEAVLQESEERFRNAFESAGIGMALVGLDGRWLRVNRTLCDIVGYSEDQLLHLRFADITHPEDLETDRALTRRLLEGEARYYQIEERFLHRDGQTLWVRLTASAVRDAAGTPL